MCVRVLVCLVSFVVTPCLASCGTVCAHMSRTLDGLQEKVVHVERSVDEVIHMVQYLLSPHPPSSPFPPLPPPSPPHLPPQLPPFFPSLGGRDLFHDSVDVILKMFVVTVVAYYFFACFVMCRDERRGAPLH